MYKIIKCLQNMDGLSGESIISFKIIVLFNRFLPGQRDTQLYYCLTWESTPTAGRRSRTLLSTLPTTFSALGLNLTTIYAPYNVIEKPLTSVSQPPRRQYLSLVDGFKRPLSYAGYAAEPCTG